MWYYRFNDQPTGPVNEETIGSLIDDKAIQSETLVWREGMPGWLLASATELAGLFKDLPAKVPALPQSAAGERKSNRPVYIAWMATNAFIPLLLIAGCFSNLLNEWVAQKGVMVASITLSGLLILPAAISLVLELVVLYRNWCIIQDGHASTTPGRAVWFQFIPLYNLYWMFKAYWGLARDNNRYIERYFSSIPELGVRRSKPGLALTSIIFNLAGSILMSFIAGIVFLVAVSASITSESTMQIQTASQIIAYMGLGYGLIDWLLITLMVIDLYRSGDSILKAEQI